MSFHFSRDAYTSVVVSAIDIDGHVVGGALVPNIMEDDSMSGCSNADPSKYMYSVVSTDSDRTTDML